MKTLKKFVYRLENLCVPEGIPPYENQCSRAGVPNLGEMYPYGYICLSEGVYL